jgi:lipopolysaccharide export LptBFGC system permease protein LptF
MDFTQYDLDTINLLVVSYFKNGEAKTPDDVSRVLALVMKSRTQKTVAAPSESFEEAIQKIKDAAEKQKKFEPKVPWPEKPHPYVVPDYRYWGLNEPIPCGGTAKSIPGNLDRDFPRTA